MESDTIKDIPGKRCSQCGARFGVDADFCPFCGVGLVSSTWDPTRDPLIGTIVDNRYEILEPLGEGGMGTVYKARHVTLNRLFALKVLRRDLAIDADLSQRFIHEARATAAVKHPAVVAITDFGVLPDGIPYFVMELLVGDTLAARIRARGPLSPREVIAIGRKIAAGLAASHAANVIHRDLKPENVFVLSNDDVRIVDFGAAKIVGGSKLTRPGVVFGTPYYMSPEHAAGQPIDARADVYSLGVLLYELITGSVPFEADTYMGVLTKHMFEVPPPPSSRIGGGAELGVLEAVVMHALQKEPSARPQSMHELIDALDRIDGRGAVKPGVAGARTSAVARDVRAPRGAVTAVLGGAREAAHTVRLSYPDAIERSIVRKEAGDRARARQRLASAAAAGAIVALLATVALVVRRLGDARAVDTAAESSAAPLPSAAPPPLPPAPDPPPSSSVAEVATEPSEPESSAREVSAPAEAPRKPEPTRRRSETSATPAASRPAAHGSGASEPRPPDEFVDPWAK